MQRSAAALVARRVNLAAVPGQHLDGVAVDVAKNQVLCAAGEHGDAITLLTSGRRLEPDEFVGELGLYLRRHRLEFAQALGQQLEHAAAAHERLEAKRAVQPNQPAEHLQPSVLGEEPLESHVPDQSAPCGVDDLFLLHLGTGVLEQLGVVHPGRAGRHARKAAETKIHFVGECFCGLEFAIGDGAHERDAAARAVSLKLGLVIRRAGGQAHAAVHALLHD